jgi:hypothetical protein
VPAAVRKQVMVCRTPRRSGRIWARGTALACIALPSEDGAGLNAALAAAALGIHPPGWLRNAARAIGVGACGLEPGWLEVVLSGPTGSIWPGSRAYAPPRRDSINAVDILPHLKAEDFSY